MRASQLVTGEQITMDVKQTEEEMETEVAEEMRIRTLNVSAGAAASSDTATPNPIHATLGLSPRLLLSLFIQSLCPPKFSPLLG